MYKETFINSAADAIYERLTKERPSALSALDDNKNSLIVAKTELVKSKYEEMFPDRGNLSGGIGHGFDSGAHKHGSEVGSSMTLRRGVKKSGSEEFKMIGIK